MTPRIEVRYVQILYNHLRHDNLTD